VSDAEVVKQDLRFEIGHPQRHGLPLAQCPVFGDGDGGVGSGGPDGDRGNDVVLFGVTLWQRNREKSSASGRWPRMSRNASLPW
jgi:hypothetical protein